VQIDETEIAARSALYDAHRGAAVGGLPCGELQGEVN
jgi:hypothetical protein